MNEQLLRLLTAMGNRELTEEQQIELETLVRSDAQACRQYIRHVHLQASLPRIFGYSPNNSSLSAELQLPVMRIERKVRPPLISKEITRSAWLSSSLAASFVALMFYGSFVLLAWNLRPDPSSSNDHNATSLAEVDSVNQPVATLTEITSAAWNQIGSRKPRRENSAIHAGEMLELISGQAQLTFTDGARVLLEGPCKFMPQNSGRGRLEHGKLMASVPARAIGFAIATPTIEIIDLGTEFGVEADAKGQTNVEVFQGKVDVKYPSAMGVTQAPPRTVRISAGQAKRFNQQEGAVKVNVVDVTPGMKNRLAKTSSMAAQKESSQDYAVRYAAAILADHPLAYWRLTDGDTGVAVDASGNGHNGSYHRAMRSHQPGIWPGSSDRSVRFLGSDAPGWLEMKDLQIPASFTAELWARSATAEWNSYGWLISSPGPAGFLMCPNTHSRDWGFHLLIEGKDPIVGTVVGYHQPEKINDRFHHYATVYDAESNRGWLFFDGVEVLKAEHVLAARRREAIATNTLWIGTYFTDNLGNLGEGWVDEIAIYGRALSSEEIRRHFDAAGIDGTTSRSTSPKSDGGQ